MAGVTTTWTDPTVAIASGGLDGAVDDNISPEVWDRLVSNVYHVYTLLSGYAQAALTVDATMATGTWTDSGAALSLAAGTWLVMATATMLDTSTGANLAARITDGTTHYSASQHTAGGASFVVSITPRPVVIVLASTTTIKLQGHDSSSANGKVLAATSIGSTGNIASGITAKRIA